jgi:predicted phage terminase large subunit-like protein
MEMNKEIQKIIDMMIKDRNVRRALSRESLRLFFGTYFGHYIEHPFAPFHIEMFQLAEDPSNQTIVIMAARNSAKSAIMNTALAIWSVLGVQQKKYVMIVSRTQQRAKGHFMSMRRELEDNKLLRSDLGPFETTEGEWGSVVSLTKYNAEITFASMEQSLRGMRQKQYRLDLIIADDIEDSDSVRTIDGRNKTYDWLTKDALPASDLEKLRIVLLGTLLHEDSVMMRFKKEIENGTRSGVYKEYPLMDDDGNILWEGKYPDQAAIEKQRLLIGDTKAWAQEFLLKILSNHERVVHPDWIHYEECPLPTKENGYRGTYVSIDPAISEEKKAAYTAMVVIRVFGYNDNLRLYVLPHPVNEHLEFPAAIDRVKKLSVMYGDGRKAMIYVEDVGFQRALVQQLTTDGYPADGVRPQGDKRARLALVTPKIKNGTVRFAPKGNEDLVNQLVNFGGEKYKDLADALSMLIPEIITNQPTYHPFPNQVLKEKTDPMKNNGGVSFDQNLLTMIF